MDSLENEGHSQGVLYIRVPYYIGDLQRDPKLDTYPYVQPSHEEASVSRPWGPCGLCSAGIFFFWRSFSDSGGC